MTQKEAWDIVGGLSKPSKMPTWAYGISPSKCHLGGKLRDVENSVCSECYACKGMYRFKKTQLAHQRRFESLSDPRWVEAMTYLIISKKLEFFRWHDAGDLQGVAHLELILEVVRNTSSCKHWLPTKESKLLLDYPGVLPDNLVVRVSSPLIDMRPLKSHANTSTVHRLRPAHEVVCTAPENKGKCGDCRACWDVSVPNISYAYH